MVRPVGRLLLLAFLAAILASPRAGAQYFPSPPSLAMPQGQAFINPLTAPDGGPRVPVSPARFRVWVGAVYQHRPGEADEASRPIRSWSTADLAGILITLDGVQLALVRAQWVGVVHIGGWTTTVAELRELLALTPAEVLSGDLTRLRKRGAILHTDIAATASTLARSRLPDHVATLDVPSLHFGMAMELVDRLRAQDLDQRNPRPEAWRRGPEAAFIRSWYVAIAAFLQSQYEIARTTTFLDRALELFPDDPRLLLMAGGARELLASPRVQEGADVDRDLAPPGSRAEYLRKAEGFYRRALAADATLVEARVRLGRVLGLTGRHKQALVELQAARADDADRAVRYFRLLFIGDEQAALGNADAARQAYTDALQLYPGAPSGLLAMSSFDRRRGAREAAASAVRDLLEVAPGPAPDPWTQYYAAGDGRRAQQLLDDLRDMIRRR